LAVRQCPTLHTSHPAMIASQAYFGSSEWAGYD
jgi:hypothetical protein